MVEEKDKSSYKSKAYNKLINRWTYVGNLWEDSYEIRQKGKEILSQMQREKDSKYDWRLNDSVFENDFRGTIEGIAGQVFRKDPTPQEVHKEISDLFTDIDGCGNSFISFNQDGFEKYLRDGNAAIFVDAPPLNAVSQEKVNDGQKPTLADRQNDRPNWVLVEAKQILNYSFEKVGSSEVLSHVTFEEKTIEKDGKFGEKEVVRHRILYRGSFEVEIQVKNERSGQMEFVNDSSIPQGATGLDFIPFFPADEFYAEPPFMTLAMMNVKLYNAVSRFDDSVYIATVPRWIMQYDSFEDAQKAKELDTASASVGTKIYGQFANAFYAETSGTALGVARDRYQDLEKRMEKFGFGMFTPSEIAPRTATEVEDTAGKRESKVARLTRKWQNAVEKAMWATAMYLNVIKGVKTVPTDDAEKQKMKLLIDYDRLTFSIDQLRAFDLLSDKGKLSNKTFLEKLAILTEIDAEQEQKRLKEEEPMRLKEMERKAALMGGNS